MSWMKRIVCWAKGHSTPWKTASRYYRSMPRNHPLYRGRFKCSRCGIDVGELAASKGVRAAKKRLGINEAVMSFKDRRQGIGFWQRWRQHRDSKRLRKEFAEREEAKRLKIDQTRRDILARLDGLEKK